MNKTYLQYGCGWSAPAGWRNFDASPTLRFERLPIIGRLWTRNASRFPDNAEYGDIINGLPIPEASCNAVYCSHILEHLSLNDLRQALRNTCQLLKPGGCFRLVVPDLQQAIEQYSNELQSNQAAIAAINFMQNTDLGLVHRPRGLSGLFKQWLGNSLHLWMWDFDSLQAELQAAGFCQIRRAEFGDSSNPCFTEVEDDSRWQQALGIECYRPQP